jgi:hypothetical protein
MISNGCKGMSFTMSIILVGEHESMIPIVSFFTCQIMGIVGSQIEMDIILFNTC